MNLTGNPKKETVEKGGNISLSDRILAYLYYLIEHTKISPLLKYRRLYRNYMTIAMHILRKNYPVEAILRNGDKLLLRNEFEALHVIYTTCGRYDGFEYDTENDIVTISMPSHIHDKTK